MTITHIPANDWATVGARLERAVSDGYILVILRRFDGNAGVLACGHACKEPCEGLGKTPIEALTAALDAAEGAK